MHDPEPVRGVKRLIAREVRFGFLRVPAAFQHAMPRARDGRVDVYLGANGTRLCLRYNPDLCRLFGLTRWYRQVQAAVGDRVTLESLGERACRLRLERPAAADAAGDDPAPPPAAKPLLLNATEKGKLIENRIADLLLLHGAGQLSVYVPVSDTDGVDLIVLHKGRFKQVYLQVKSRFACRSGGRQFVWDVSTACHRARPAHLVLCVHFSAARRELDEHVLLIPSERLWQLAMHVGRGRQQRLRIASSLPPTPRCRYHPYACRVDELAAVLLNELKLQGRYLR